MIDITYFFTDRTSPAKRYVRTTDPEASHVAALFAVSSKAAAQRLKIIDAVLAAKHEGLTCKEIAANSGIAYEAVRRRTGECGLRYESKPLRAGCGVWYAY